MTVFIAIAECYAVSESAPQNPKREEEKANPVSSKVVPLLQQFLMLLFSLALFFFLSFFFHRTNIGQMQAVFIAHCKRNEVLGSMGFGFISSSPHQFDSNMHRQNTFTVSRHTNRRIETNKLTLKIVMFKFLYAWIITIVSCCMLSCAPLRFIMRLIYL